MVFNELPAPCKSTAFACFSCNTQAYRVMAACHDPWFFCRGFFLQASSSFQPYSEAELGGSALAF
jgi:hypothetical protein